MGCMSNATPWTALVAAVVALLGDLFPVPVPADLLPGLDWLLEWWWEHLLRKLVELMAETLRTLLTSLVARWQEWRRRRWSRRRRRAEE